MPNSDDDEPLKPYQYVKLRKKPGHIRVLVLQSSRDAKASVVCHMVETNVLESSVSTDVQYQRRRGSDQSDGQLSITDNKDRARQNYEAVSWCWPAEVSKEESIVIRHEDVDYTKNIPETLAEALKAFRYRNRSRFLWIDRICIDQNDLVEKTQQVRQMAIIYQQARNVCVWLGLAGEDSRLALPFIRNHLINLQHFDELMDKEEHRKSWDALFNFMRREWFSRRWVVQEIALARSAIVYCGNETIPWTQIAIAVELFSQSETATHKLSSGVRSDPKFHHVSGWFDNVSDLNASLLVKILSKLFYTYRPMTAENEDTTIVEDLEMDGPSPRIPASRPLLTLEQLVTTLAGFGVSKQHDAVFALLAIASDATPTRSDDESSNVGQDVQVVLQGYQARKGFTLNYNQSFIETCKDFIAFCVDHSDQTRALDILFRPWAPGRDPWHQRRKTRFRQRPPGNHATSSQPRMRNDDDTNLSVLPSWACPAERMPYGFTNQPGRDTKNLRRKNADTLVGPPLPDQEEAQKKYSAAGGAKLDRRHLAFRKDEDTNQYSLHVHGFCLDRVSDKLPESQNGNIPESWVDLGDWTDCPEGDPPDKFWRTLVANRGHNGGNPPHHYALACKESFKRSFYGGSFNTTDLINNERSRITVEFCRRVESVVWNRSLIKTQGGRLGLVPIDCKEQDLICIFYGCSVPVVLRKMVKPLAEVEKFIERDVKYYLEQMYERICTNFKRHKEWKRSNPAAFQRDFDARAQRVQRQREIRVVIRKIADELEKKHKSTEMNGAPNRNESPGPKDPPEASSSMPPPLPPEKDHGDSLNPVAGNSHVSGSSTPRQKYAWPAPPRSDHESSRKNDDYIARLKQWYRDRRGAESDQTSYYEIVGECYLHGMMDGEAMRLGNLQRQVFELR